MTITIVRNKWNRGHFGADQVSLYNPIEDRYDALGFVCLSVMNLSPGILHEMISNVSTIAHLCTVNPVCANLFTGLYVTRTESDNQVVFEDTPFSRSIIDINDDLLLEEPEREYQLWKTFMEAGVTIDLQ